MIAIKSGVVTLQNPVTSQGIRFIFHMISNSNTFLKFCQNLSFYIIFIIFSEKIIREFKSAILHISQNHATFQHISTKTSLKYFFKWSASMRISTNVFITFLKLLMNKYFFVIVTFEVIDACIKWLMGQKYTYIR